MKDYCIDRRNFAAYYFYEIGMSISEMVIKKYPVFQNRLNFRIQLTFVNNIGL